MVKCVCGHDISKHNLHGCFDNPTVTSGCGCSRPPQQVSIDAHLSGTGHATLAEMRAEFDAMMEEVNVSRRYVDRLWKDLDNVAVPRPPYYPGLTRDYTEAKEATDAARPKEPT